MNDYNRLNIRQSIIASEEATVSTVEVLLIVNWFFLLRTLYGPNVR